MKQLYSLLERLPTPWIHFLQFGSQCPWNKVEVESKSLTKQFVYWRARSLQMNVEEGFRSYKFITHVSRQPAHVHKENNSSHQRPPQDLHGSTKNEINKKNI